MDNGISKINFIDEAKKIEQESIRNAQGHYCAARRWAYIHQALGIPSVILAAITSASAFSKLDTDGYITGGLALLIAAFTALTTFLNPGEKSQRHLNAGNKFDTLIHLVRLFYRIDIPLKGQDQKNTEKLEEFSKLWVKIKEESPQIPGWAFRMALRDLKTGAADYVLSTEP